MTDRTATEATDLRERIAEALRASWDLAANEHRDDAIRRDTAAVLAAVQPELERLRKAERAVNLLADSHRRAEQLEERLRLLTDEKVADLAGPTIHLLCEQIAQLKAEVSAARGFADEMRDFCSPHGVATDYADRLVQAMDRAKESQS